MSVRLQRIDKLHGQIRSEPDAMHPVPVKLFVPKSRIAFGLGRCGRCNCVAFKGTGYICEYCGHHYDDHGTSPF